MKPKKDKLERNFDKYRTELQKLEMKYNGRLTPKDIVREAASINSPIHNWFDWSDDSAGEKWRMHQARMLLNSIKVKIMYEKGAKEYRQYLNVNVKQNGKKSQRYYVNIDEVRQVPDMKQQILQRALSEAAYWKRTYQDYMELENIFNAIIRTEKKLKKKLKIKIPA